MLTNFQNYCTYRFINKFAIKSVLIIPPHLKDVAKLPCEILRSENSDNQSLSMAIFEHGDCCDIAIHLGMLVR